MKWLIAHKFLAISILLLIAGGGVFFVSNKRNGELEALYTVVRGNVVREISVSGRVQATDVANLAFEKSGRILRVNKDIGQNVRAGEVLVSLENGDIAAQLAEAEANVKIEQAKYDELLRGTRPEEITVQETKVANARVALLDARKELFNKMLDAYTKADDAVRNQVDQFITNPTGSSPELVFLLGDGTLEAQIEAGRVSTEILLKSWKKFIDALSTEGDFEAAASETNKNLVETRNFLDKVALGVNSLKLSATFSQTTIDTYKSSVSTARTNVNTALSNLSTALEGFRVARSNLALEEENLALKKAGSTPEALRAQEAKLEQVRASAANYRAQLAKTIIAAPFSGVVTAMDAKVGEIAPANTVVTTLISASDFEIEVKIPETDIADIMVGNSAIVTLDAYDDETVFNAKVTHIDPAETLVDGVSSYKATLQFEEKDPRVRSGMTANVIIHTKESIGVVYIPRRAIIERDGGKYVTVVSGREKREQLVETGLSGSGGVIEITYGINEGDTIYLPQGK